MIFKENIPLTRPSMPDYDEYAEEIKSLWDSHYLTNSGEKHVRLQNELKKYFGVENLELTVNGHMALEVAMQSLGLMGEVITTPYTFMSTTEAIIRSGLKPVFCDINKDDYTIDTSKIEELITDKTSAIVAVHVYGNICDVEGIERIAKKHNLKVIYDAAHCFGVTFNGKSVACFGDASCYSFHATKVFNTIEGGAICFKNAYDANRARIIRNFGISGLNMVDFVGTNAKMNEFAAAMGLCNLKHVEEQIEKRKAVFELYHKRLSNIDGLKIMDIQKGVKSNYAYYPVIFDKDIFGANRDEVFVELELNGIGSRRYFYPATNNIECLAKAEDKGNTPVSDYLSENVLALPLYADLSENDINRICDMILNLKK